MHVVHTTEKGKGTGRKKTLAYFSYMIETGQLVAGDHGSVLILFVLLSFVVVLLDNERALNVKEAREFLSEHGVTVHNFIPYLGHLLDPCDNSFHGDEQNRIDGFVEAVQDYKALTGDDKMRIIKESYCHASRKSIISYFKRCGFIDNGKSPRAVLSALLDDVRSHANRTYQKYHEKNLRKYLQWMTLKGKVPVDAPQRIGPWWQLIRMFRSELNR